MPPVVLQREPAILIAKIRMMLRPVAKGGKGPFPSVYDIFLDQGLMTMPQDDGVKPFVKLLLRKRLHLFREANLRLRGHFLADNGA